MDWQLRLYQLIWKHPECGVRIEDLVGFTIAELWGLYVHLREKDEQ